MPLKLKLLSSISAFILTLSCLLIGVFAAQNVSLNVGGNVSFTATSVYAEITGSIKGTAEHSNSSPLNLSTISIDYTDTETEIDLSGENSDWISMPLNFDENASDITVTINIRNLAQDRAIAVSLTDNTNISSVSVGRKYNNSTFTGNTTSQTIAGGQTGIFTFTLSLANKNNDVSGKFDIDLKLENAKSATLEDYNITVSNPTNVQWELIGDDIVKVTLPLDDNGNPNGITGVLKNGKTIINLTALYATGDILTLIEKEKSSQILSEADYAQLSAMLSQFIAKINVMGGENKVGTNLGAVSLGFDSSDRQLFVAPTAFQGAAEISSMYNSWRGLISKLFGVQYYSDNFTSVNIVTYALGVVANQGYTLFLDRYASNGQENSYTIVN